MNVYITPNFRGVDKGDGGIRRVVEAQRKYLPSFGIDVVDNAEAADLVAIHAASDMTNYQQPIVEHCHGLYWSEYSWPKWAQILNRDVIAVMNKADAVTAPSYWVANSIQRGMLINPEVIYHGVNINEWSPGNDEGYVLWNKTRVDPICEPSVVNGLANLAVGTQFVTTFGNRSRNVTVTGKLPFEQAKQYIRNAGVYLCTAKETFGIGTLEAMACGVPILGWKWGGQAEIITNGVNGYLAEPGNIEELAYGLEQIQANRKEFSKNCRDLVLSTFTWPCAVEKYAKLYERVYYESKHPVKVSVVVPCYNLGNMVGDTVSSILNQTFQDFEIIIVNDASTDDTPVQLARLQAQDRRIKVINNSTNQYLSGALNTGIAAARGKYIIPVDADNMLGERTLEVLSHELDENRTMHVAYGAMEVLEENGHRWVSGWPGQFDYRAQMLHHNQLPSTSMYRKSIWQRVGGYRSRCRTAEDADFWCRVSSYGGNPRKVTDGITLIYRDRHDSMSHVQKDWPWNQWYSWYNQHELTPYAASVYDLNVEIPSHDTPIISVVIPVGPGHNKYLLDAIDSIIAQTFIKWELIVVNDSGTDLGWVPPFVKVYTTDSVGSGPSKARNIGIENSNAKLFVLLDSDDYLQPTALKDMYDTYLLNGGYVYCDWIVQETKERHQCRDFECDEMLRKMPHSIVGLYPKDAWKAYKFDENIVGWEDWDWLIGLAAQGLCGNRVDKGLFQYRMTAGTRREEMYSKKDEIKKYIFDKWSQFITGVKKLPCQSCGKRNQPYARSQSIDNLKNAPAEGMVLIEYVLQGNGATSYVGVSGTVYRFGSDEGH